MAPGLILYIVVCLAVGYVGRSRRIGWLGFFLASVLFTPLLTFLVLILTSPKKELPRRRAL